VAGWTQRDNVCEGMRIARMLERTDRSDVMDVWISPDITLGSRRPGTRNCP